MIKNLNLFEIIKNNDMFEVEHTNPEMNVFTLRVKNLENIVFMLYVSEYKISGDVCYVKFETNVSQYLHVSDEFVKFNLNSDNKEFNILNLITFSNVFNQVELNDEESLELFEDTLPNFLNQVLKELELNDFTQKSDTYSQYVKSFLFENIQSQKVNFYVFKSIIKKYDGFFYLTVKFTTTLEANLRYSFNFDVNVSKLLDGSWKDSDSFISDTIEDLKADYFNVLNNYKENELYLKFKDFDNVLIFFKKSLKPYKTLLDVLEVSALDGSKEFSKEFLYTFYLNGDSKVSLKDNVKQALEINFDESLNQMF